MSVYLIITSWLVLSMMTIALFSKDNNDVQERNEKIKSISDEELKLMIVSLKAAGIAFIIIVGSFWIGAGLNVSSQLLQIFIAFNFTYMIHKVVNNINNTKERKIKVYRFDKFLLSINYVFVIWFIITHIVFK